MILRPLLMGALTVVLLGTLQSGSKQADSYDVLLHSRSLADQHAALAAMMQDPQTYVPRIQQSLREYPQLLRTDWVAANRAVYISALMRDASFGPILVQNLGDEVVLDECEYPCPVVFALTIQASFGNWKLPSNLDSQLATVYDLKSSIHEVSLLNLKLGSIEDMVQGPGLEEHRKEIEGKTEEELIQMAGPTSTSVETRLFALYRLETIVSKSKNRLDLYLLALNEVRDASGEYRSAAFKSIYRAELAKAQGH